MPARVFDSEDVAERLDELQPLDKLPGIGQARTRQVWHTRQLIVTPLVGCAGGAGAGGGAIDDEQGQEDRHRAETGEAIALWLVSILGGGPLLHCVVAWFLSGSTTAPALQTTDFPL